MKIPRLPLRRQRDLFALVCVLIAIVLLVRIRPIRLLYTDAAVRADAERAIRHTAEAEGWILSDLSIRELTARRVVLVHRLHLRGPDPEECIAVDLASLAYRRCAN